MTPTRTILTIATALLAVLALAACGSSDSPDVASLGGSAADADGTSTEAATDPEEALLAFTACMREEGIDLPDPDFSGTPGQGRLRPGANGFDPSDPDFQAAQETCGVHLEGIRGRFDPERRQAFQDAALEFAQCLRDQGLDVPDPDFSQGGGPGGGPGRGIFGASGLDPDDPDVQAAMEECGQILEDAGGGFRGGPPGGGQGEDGS